MNSRNIELANEVALSYEYIRAIRERLNSHPDRNHDPLMPVDVRLELVLNHLKAAVEILRKEPTAGIPLAFTNIGSRHERIG